MLRIICTFLGVFLGAVFITGSADLLWEMLVAYDLPAAGQVLGESLFLTTKGAIGGMVGTAVGFLVGWVLDWLTGVGRNDCPSSCDDHFLSANSAR